MALKQEIANNLTQGGTRSSMNWMDIIALALPALSNSPDASTSDRTMKYWQMGRQMRLQEEERAKKEQAEAEGKAMIGDYLNSMNEQAGKERALAGDMGRISAMPKTVTQYGETPPMVNAPGTEEAGWEAFSTGPAPVQITNQEKMQELATWNKEHRRLRTHSMPPP